ncbi:MAG: H-NS histone family protein [Rhodobacteraceae bacterium]|nr:H-NS histone family protein [Paracoccaceae bacterium]
MPQVDIDLNTLSLKELKDLQSQVAKAITGFEDRKKREALVELEEAAKRLGFSLSELTATAVPRKRASAAPKYANPANKSETWTGRGRKPKWMDAALKAGKSPDDLLI